MDPEGQTVEVLTRGEAGFATVARLSPGRTLASPLLPGFTPDAAAFFAD